MRSLSSLSPGAALSPVVVSLCSLLLAACLVVPAHAFERRVAVDGWSGDGRRVVYTVEVRGAAVDGAPFRYRLRQIVDAATAEVLGSYREGEASGPEQPAWEAAGLEASAQNVLTGLRVRSEPPSPVSGDLSRSVALVTRTSIDTDATPGCPRCRVCTTRWSLVAMDAAGGFATLLDTGSLRGPSIAESDPVCAEVSADAWWSETQDAVLVVRSERAPLRVDTARVYRMDPSLPRSARVLPPRLGGLMRARAALVRAQEALRDRPDRGDALVELGRLALDAGQPEVARGYFASAEAAGVRDAGRAGALVSDALLGRRDVARDLARAARSGRGLDGLPVEAALRAVGEDDAVGRIAVEPTVSYADVLARYHLPSAIERLEALAQLAPDATVDALLLDGWLQVGDVEQAALWAPRVEEPEGADLDPLLWLGSHTRHLEDVWASGEPSLLDTDALARCRFVASMARAAAGTGRRAEARALGALALACDPDDTDALLRFARTQLVEGHPRQAVAAYAAFLERTTDRGGDRAGSDRRDEARTLLEQAESTGVIVTQYRCVVTPRVRCTGALANVGDDTVVDATALAYAFDTDGTWLGEARSEPVELAPGATRDVAFESEELAGAPLFELRTWASGVGSERGLMVSGRPSFP